MGERIVIGFLMQALPAPSEPAGFLERASDLLTKAEARGGRLVAFGARSVAFDFAIDDLEEAISLATAEHDEAASESVRWGTGIAQGELEPLGSSGSLVAPSWGSALVTAIGLARVARAGELLVDPDLPAVKEGEVLTTGSRVGRDGSRRVRGLTLDPRRIFRRETAERNIAQLTQSRFVARQGWVRDIVASRAPLSVVRADPGFGGTRFLQEVEVACLPARSLLFATCGAEPLGALRGALARSIAMSGPVPSGSLDGEEEDALARILAGAGAPLASCAKLVARWVTLGQLAHAHARPGAILVDDAMEIDDPSLAAARCATLDAQRRARLVVRLDSTSPLPPRLSETPHEGDGATPEFKLGVLPRARAEELVSSVARDMLSPEGQKRWAKRGRNIPLGLVEALADGVMTGELTWVDDVVTPRSRAAGQQLEPKEWIAKRLRFLAPHASEVLAIVALLGVEVTISWAHATTERLGVRRVTEHIDALARAGWILRVPDGFYTLPSRTHRDVILSAVSEEKRELWHAAASSVLAERGGALTAAEAARHAALSGDSGRAAELAVVAARASRALGLDDAADALFEFAEVAEHQDVAPLPSARSSSPSLPAPPSFVPSPFRTESFIETLRAGGLSDETAGRIEALVALRKGEKAEALARLREGVTLARDASPAVRSRAKLAYGIALAVTGHPAEALIAALDALARAREADELLGQQACARFLGRLSLAAGNQEAALTWRKISGEKIPS